MGRRRRARQKRNSEEKMRVMSEASDAYSARRPHEQEARQKAFQNQASAYGNVNNFLGMMYGDSAMVDTSRMGAPVDTEMMGVGRSKGAPGLGPSTAADADFGHATGGEVWDPPPEHSGGDFTVTYDGETSTRSGDGVGSTSQGLTTDGDRMTDKDFERLSREELYELARSRSRGQGGDRMTDKDFERSRGRGRGRGRGK